MPRTIALKRRKNNNINDMENAYFTVNKYHKQHWVELAFKRARTHKTNNEACQWIVWNWETFFVSLLSVSSFVRSDPKNYSIHRRWIDLCRRLLNRSFSGKKQRKKPNWRNMRWKTIESINFQQEIFVKLFMPVVVAVVVVACCHYSGQ